jgi:Tfp pilus assembly protein PilV
MKIKSNRRLKILITVAIVLVCSVSVVALAKYLYQRNKTGTVKAKAFYFTSNLLEDSSQDTITLAPETETIEFTLGNHDDKLRYSDVDIKYDVYIDDTKLDMQQETLESTGINDKTISINLSTVDKGTTHTIKAIGYSVDKNGNASYHKTLSANFVIQSEETGIYKWLDTSNSEYVLLTVWSKGQIGNVTITFPSENVIPDNTDIAMRDAETTVGSFKDSVSFSVNQNYSSHVYRFFRNNGSDVAVGDFTVTDSNGKTADVKQPQ